MLNQCNTHQTVVVITVFSSDASAKAHSTSSISSADVNILISGVVCFFCFLGWGVRLLSVSCNEWKKGKRG